MLHLKSEREMQLMRQAGLIVWQAHQLVRKMVAPGVVTRDIDAAVAQFFREANAEPLFLNYPHSNRNKPAFPAVACISVNDEVVHGIPSDRVLQEGDIVSIDMGARVHGWCGDAARTYAVGEISDENQKLLDVTNGTLDLAIDLMSKKSIWSDVAREMADYVRDHKFSVVECFVGHGIGRELHEDPQVPNFLSRGLRGAADFRIEPGLVIAVEPMVNIGTNRVKLLPDEWTQVTYDGSASAHFEHTIAVRSSGPWLLTHEPSPEEEGLLVSS